MMKFLKRRSKDSVYNVEKKRKFTRKMDFVMIVMRSAKTVCKTFPRIGLQMQLVVNVGKRREMFQKSLVYVKSA